MPAEIICPYCKHLIPLDEALTHQLRNQLKVELESQMAQRERELEEKADNLAKKENEIKKLKEAQEEELKALKSAYKKEFEKQREALQKEFQEKIDIAKRHIEEEAKKRAEEKVYLELSDLKSQLQEKAEQIRKFQEMELQLRKEKRKIEEERQNLELEVARKVDEEREKIRSEVANKIMEEHRFKDMEKDKLITQLKNQIEDLKRRVEQGSQQLQGEVMEIELEELLKTNFIHDRILPVPKGRRGADLLQQVYNSSGHICGTIIWEVKRTKVWNDGWIEKLKEDQRETKADIAAIVSTVLPKCVRGIAQIEGVWVSDFGLAVGLSSALRTVLIEVAATKASLEGRREKMEMLYEYLSGPEFRQQIEGIVEAFSSMKKDLDEEKRAMERIWAKREKQIQKVIKNTSRMYGSLQGIIGRSLPELSSLEMPRLIDSEMET
jgi:hypothetical protein